MPRLNIHSLRMQISRMHEMGQSFFCAVKVQDWLKQRNEDPNDYEIIFHQKPAPPGTGLVMMVEVELRRKDGESVNPWLQEEVNRYA
jgi:hypothetical protein